MMRFSNEWTEDELSREIQRLNTLIDQAAKGSDTRSRCAMSYLQQVMKDRIDALAVIRHDRLH